MSPPNLDLIVSRTDLSDAAVKETTLPDPLPEGACLLRIDKFALTANNITYGVAADMLGYWDFFPTGSQKTGRLPVWGFAEVVASAHEGVAPGERVYGYLPMSSHLVVYPGKITEQGFMDTAPHRAERAPIYNTYALTRSDPIYRASDEALISLFRPLFTTAFLLEDLHRENDFFGARQIILSSASSKTAIGLAHLLAESRPDTVEIVGLTSPGNMAFVQSLGCYDRVTAYDDIGSLPAVDSAFVDMAGSGELREKIHNRFGDRLQRSTAVGITHWQDATDRGMELPGPKPEFFFAPAYAQDRVAVWGMDGFQQRLGKAWTGFTDHARTWCKVVERHGPDEVLAQYRAVLNGDMKPDEGYILSMS